MFVSVLQPNTMLYLSEQNRTYIYLHTQHT